MARRGFTLTELMISLVMVLLLVLAVSQIFRVTTTTIGKGNATSEVIRGLDAARIALQIDFSGTDAIGYSGFTDKTGILPADRQPAIIISSTSVPAFLGPRDLEGDNDYDEAAGTGIDTLDSNNDGTDDLLLGPYHTGRRWFRLDSLSFFTGGEYESQTNLGRGGGFYGNATSEEAWVWYGHARVYDGEGPPNLGDYPPGGPKAGLRVYPLPGEGDATINPNNFFASQFVLLRAPMLLKPQYDHDGDGSTAITATNDVGGIGGEIFFVRPDWDTQQASQHRLLNGTVPNVGPFAFESEVRVFDASITTPSPDAYDQSHSEVPAGASDPYVIQDSRVDVAGVTAAQYRERLAAVQTAPPVSPGAANGPLRFGGTDTWYNRIFARTTPNRANLGRFWINPLVLKPLDAGEVSQASGYLLGGATQFIVEYAGDFLAQLSDGDIDWNNGGMVPDGIIDFTVDAAGVRHIRFYGMPRDVDADGTIPGPALAPSEPGPTFPTDPLLLRSTDTRPLADYLPRDNSALNVDTGFPFEKRLPSEYSPGSPDESMDTRVNITDYLDPSLYTDNFDWSYLAAWGPGDFDGGLYSPSNSTHPYSFISPAVPQGSLRPSLIRVIVQGIDSRERLEEPISMELIFRVPAE